ncbi:Treslin [Fukomys damarensis]|uniref:Treslin n=1 Tax=Fukomys damarensis TaxID=885580 RepID=A0A091DR26_FUKDA|nr:Treslin [Fukomys damarensis]
MVARKITFYWVDTTERSKVASVDPGEGWPPITGVLSPLSASAMILTVFHAKEAEFQGHFLQTVVAGGPQDTASLFSDVMDGVLNQIHHLFEDAAASASPVPEWAQQELGRTTAWSPAVLEKWFLFSNISGASSSLMESFWSLQDASANKEQSSKTESELTRCLSALYQRKSREESTVANQEDSRKKRGIPRTPVRQKMNTMCRSLKMLNVARLNVKAQKLHPDGSPDVAGEKAIQKIVSGRAAEKPEDRGRSLRSSKPKDFKTEEELLSYIHENYQKTVTTGEVTLYSCAQNTISNIKVFLKSKGAKEIEVTALLRIVCLTEDSAYLANFLEEILKLYADSIPETLGKLYNSLGFEIPQKLAGILPADFFSDDSMTQDSKSPLVSVPLPLSAHRSVSGSTEADQLEELRTRSAKKRSGTTTPDTIKDWPQRKRAMDCSSGVSSGRGKANTDPEPQAKEQGLELGLHKTAVSEDFELEGTPKRSYRKSPSFPKTTPRGFPRTPQIAPCSPDSPLHPTMEMTPTEPAMAEKAPQQPSSPSHFSQSASRATVQEGPSLTEGASPLGIETPRTPTRPGAQPPGFLLNCAWPHLVNSSPESPGCPASPTPSAAQSQSEFVTSKKQCLRTPLKIVALLGPPQDQKCQQPLLPRVPQAEEPAQTLKDNAVQTPKRPRDTTVTSSPLVAPEKWDIAKSPLRSPSTASPGSGELDQKEHPVSPSWATSPSCAGPSTSPTVPQRVTSVTAPPPPPSKLERRCRKTSNPEQSSLECQPGLPSVVLEVATATSPVATMGSRKGGREGSPTPEEQRHLGAGVSNDWHGSSPLLIASDTDYLTLLDEAQHWGGGSHAVRGGISPGGEGTGLRTADRVWKPPSISDDRTSPPAACSGPGSPVTASYILCWPPDGWQHQAVAQLESPRTLVRPPQAPSSPQTYEVELEMQASGLPKLRIKKVDSSALAETETLGEDGSLPGLSMPRVSRATSKPEATYMSPPCLRPSHSTPGKGQTYICQSCTPTHGPSTTPSPFQTDVGIPWTPSPKHSGKTTPDTIKDWPRRKRAVDCSNGVLLGRGEAGTDPEPQAKEQGLELSLHKTAVPEDFELEGVCQLPDQSPPADSVPKAEESFLWGQFGLGSRKRPLSAKEEAECGAKRVYEAPREGADMNQEKGCPRSTVLQLPSTGDDEVFAFGCTPPHGCAVRSCLSASGLQALTQSPLLLPRKAASSQCSDPTDENADAFAITAEASPLSQAFSRRRPFSRTYTRKKLIS